MACGEISEHVRDGVLSQDCRGDATRLLSRCAAPSVQRHCPMLAGAACRESIIDGGGCGSSAACRILLNLELFSNTWSSYHNELMNESDVCVLSGVTTIVQLLYNCCTTVVHLLYNKYAGHQGSRSYRCRVDAEACAHGISRPRWSS